MVSWPSFCLGLTENDKEPTTSWTHQQVASRALQCLPTGACPRRLCMDRSPPGQSGDPHGPPLATFTCCAPTFTCQAFCTIAPPGAAQARHRVVRQVRLQPTGG